MLLERHSLLRLPFDVRRGGSLEREPQMDDARFDEMARGLESRLTRLTRRHAGGLATGALLALGLATDSDAKKKKKKKKSKKKKKNKSGSFACNNLGGDCGSSPTCQCRREKNNKLVCLSNPFDLGVFQCASQADCPKGTFCDDGSSLCASGC